MAKKPSRRRRLGRPRNADRADGSPSTREQILEAASDLFAERGFEGAPMSELAERAGLTTGAIYRHFESKADVLLHVVDRALLSNPIARRLREGTVTTPAELARMITAFNDPRMQRVRRLAIEIQSAAFRDPKAMKLFTKLVSRTHQSIAEFLHDAVSRGDLPKSLDVARTTSLLLVVSMGLTHLDTLEPSLLGDPAWARFVERTVASLLRPPAG